MRRWQSQPKGAHFGGLAFAKCLGQTNVLTEQDCAGAILYSSDRAVEVAMEAQQCLGGNGYINGRSRLAWAQRVSDAPV